MKLPIYSKLRGGDKAKTSTSHSYVVTDFGSCQYLVGEVFLSDLSHMSRRQCLGPAKDGFWRLDVYHWWIDQVYTLFIG